MGMTPEDLRRRMRGDPSSAGRTDPAGLRRRLSQATTGAEQPEPQGQTQGVMEGVQQRMERMRTRGPELGSPGGEEEEGLTAGQTLGRQALHGFVNNVLGLPSDFAEILRRGGGGLLFPTGDLLPESISEAVPSPTTRDFSAAARTVPGAAGAIARGEDPEIGRRFGEQERMLQERDEEIRQQHPIASATGELVGDASTLVAARAPISARLRRFSTPPRRSGRVAMPAPSGAGAAKRISVGIQRQYRDFVNKDWVQNTGRNFRRAAETGLDGAFMGLIQDNDPAVTAGLAAGAQSAGGLSLHLAKEITASAPRFLTTLAATTLGYHIVTQAMPGVQQNIFESLDKGSNKVIAALGTGVLSGMAGLGRLPRRMQENLDVLGDAITPALRTPLLSVLSGLTEAEEKEDPDFVRVIERFQEDPEAFGEDARNRIEQAINSEDRNLYEEVNQMMKDDDFRSLLEED